MLIYQRFPRKKRLGKKQWLKNMVILDTNALLRYVLGDIPDQAETAAGAVQEGCITTTEIIAEVVYVLQSVYKVSREDISWTVHCILLDVKAENVKTLRYAMGVFDQTNLDFVDCLLVAYKKVLGLDVLSFDKKLNSAITRGFEIFQT